MLKPLELTLAIAREILKPFGLLTLAIAREILKPSRLLTLTDVR